MKLILLYGVPIIIAVLLHIFGFTTDASAKAELSMQAGGSGIDDDPQTKSVK